MSTVVTNVVADAANSVVPGVGGIVSGIMDGLFGSSTVAGIADKTSLYNAIKNNHKSPFTADKRQKVKDAITKSMKFKNSKDFCTPTRVENCIKDFGFTAAELYSMGVPPDYKPGVLFYDISSVAGATNGTPLSNGAVSTSPGTKTSSSTSAAAQGSGTTTGVSGWFAQNKMVVAIGGIGAVLIGVLLFRKPRRRGRSRRW